MLPLKETKIGVTFSVQVIPRASKCEIVGATGDALKVKLSAPPVEGKANEACLRFLAEQFNLARNRLSIIGGQTSRKKVIQVSGMKSNEMAMLLKSVIPAANRAPELFDMVVRKDIAP